MFGGFDPRAVLVLGTVHLAALNSYTLESRTIYDGEELKAAHPTLAVRRAPMEVENDIVLGSLGSVTSLTVVVIGLTWLSRARHGPAPTKNPSGHS